MKELFTTGRPAHGSWGRAARAIVLGLLVVVGGTLASSCRYWNPIPPEQKDPPPPQPTGCQTVELDKEFQMKVGSTACVDREKLQVTFKGVTEDSRCPRGVECAWAGQATIALLVSVDGITSEVVTLTIGPGSPDNAHPMKMSSAKVGDYTITATGLDPYPVYPDKIDPNDYLVSLLITK